MLRRLLLAALASLVLAVPARAVDLDNMGLDDLLTLREQIDAAIWANPEWEHVELARGAYLVGEDIPAGRWTLASVDGSRVTLAYGRDLGRGGDWVEDLIYYCKVGEGGDRDAVTWTFDDGGWLVIRGNAASMTRAVSMPIEFHTEAE